MRLISISEVPWSQELGSDLLAKTEIKTVFDEAGHPSHLLAYISDASFQSLYGPSARTSVFISGLWLLFTRTSSGYTVECRTTGLRFECIFASGPFDKPIISFFRRGLKIATTEARNLTLDELEWDDRGVRWLSLRLLRFIQKEMGPGLSEWVQNNRHPSLHILPERALPRDFRASAVNLQ